MLLTDTIWKKVHTWGWNYIRDQLRGSSMFIVVMDRMTDEVHRLSCLQMTLRSVVRVESLEGWS